MTKTTEPMRKTVPNGTQSKLTFYLQSLDFTGEWAIKEPQTLARCGSLPINYDNEKLKNTKNKNLIPQKSNEIFNLPN
jgi:hypothetical protein